MACGIVIRLGFATTVCLGLLTIGCPAQHDGPTNHDPKPTVSPSANATMMVRYIPTQGWNARTRDRFHYISQGSQLIPYVWFLNLPEPDGKTLFKDDLYKYGMLFEPPSSDPLGLNPDRLPVGFAKAEAKETINDVPERHWLGLTCAACHTGAITYKAAPADATETTLIIDGAPSSSDLGAFLTDLGAAVQATSNDPQKLQAFAARVVAAGDGKSVDDVIPRFKKFASQFAAIVAMGTPTHPWGPGRVDAFGVIFDRASNYDLKNPTDRPLPPDAPVSYPFLWYSGRQDHIQWHGEVPNQDWIHRLGRNTGEVVGVFARVDVRPGQRYYVSSVDPIGLGRLDEYVETLNAPPWQKSVFGTLDASLVAAGKTLFHQNCGMGWCHHDVPSAGEVIKTKPTPLHGSDTDALDTDPAMTMLVHTRKSATAQLAGTPQLVIFGARFGASAPASDIVGNIGAGSLLGRRSELIAAVGRHLLVIHTRAAGHTADETASVPAETKVQAAAATTSTAIATAYRVTDPTQTGGASTGFDPKVHGYESRPLAGIWATAPYLHNGSVPNLYQLLGLEPRQRQFYVGSLEFDPIRVGYISDGSRGGKLFDTIPAGNTNTGHMYGWNLSPTDKKAIIEYLKSL